MDNKTGQATNRFSNWTYFFWLALLWVAVFYFFGLYRTQDALRLSFSDFENKVSSGGVTNVVINGENLTGTLREPVIVGTKENERTYKKFETTIPRFAGQQVLTLLQQNGVEINVQPQTSPWFATLLIGWLPWILILAFFFYSSRKLRDIGGGGAFGFGKSKAKLYTKSSSKTTFNDVAGLNNAKKELVEIVEFLKNPSKFRVLGGKLPKGLLLAGPPGTGKTLLARAAAGEANVPFYSISGSEFVEMFVGVGASRVRDMFENAKKDAPSIIFIDEIDSIGRVRGSGLGGGHDEREQTLNQILAEMDGFAPQETVIVMAATNRPDILDPALVRPGRFDRRIVLDLPQKKARKEILEIHSREVPLADDVNLEVVADGTVGFSGADLKNLVNEAALLAARKGKDRVYAVDFDQSRDKIIMGLEREEIINENEKKIIAYHEAGHAILAKLLPGVDPLQKVTIIPRGQALGVTEQIPEEDRHTMSRTYLLDRITILLGGRVAERLVFKDVMTGAGDDLKKATQIARRMVSQWGMSEKLGSIAFKQGEEHPFLGREMMEARDYSERTAELIDEEVQRMVSSMEKRAEDVLVFNQPKMDALAEALLEHETLDNEEIDKLFQNLESRRKTEPRRKSSVGVR